MTDKTRHKCLTYSEGKAIRDFFVWFARWGERIFDTHKPDFGGPAKTEELKKALDSAKKMVGGAR